jgi:hypothetical protein
MPRIPRPAAPLLAVAAIALLALLATRGDDGGRASSRIGVSTHLMAGDEPLDQALAPIARDGVRWIREDFAWARIEPERGRYDWQRTDELMAAAAAAEVDVLAILDYSAPWATSDPGGDLEAPPRADADYARFARAVVDRYGEGGAFWDRADPVRPLAAVELWNEPWGFFFWRPEPDPARYATLARAAAEAIRAADRDVDVLVPADLLQVRADGAVRPWFAALLEADGGLPDLVDGWTVHPYPSPRAAGPGADGDLRYSVKRVAEVRAVAERERAIHPIWITEIGWTTAAETEDGVSEEEQAQYLEETLALAEGPWRDFVARTFVYTWSRSTGAAGDVEGNYGLRRADGSVKPAWRVVREHASDGED